MFERRQVERERVLEHVDVLHAEVDGFDVFVSLVDGLIEIAPITSEIAPPLHCGIVRFRPERAADIEQLARKIGPLLERVAAELRAGGYEDLDPTRMWLRDPWQWDRR